MTERFKGEKVPTPENPEDQKYSAFQSAMVEEERIRKEIDSVLATTSDRAEAERIVLEKFASQMDEAMQKSKQALEEWLGAMREAGEKERE